MAITHETNGKTKTKQRGPASSPGVEQAVLAAQAEAAKGNVKVSPPHVFLALLGQGEILPYLAQNGVDVAEARLYAEAAIPEDNQDERAFAQVVKYAGYEAWREASSIIQTQHLLIALVRQQKWSDFPGVLESLGLNLAELREQSLSARKGHQKYATGHPLNQANKASQAALDAAEAAMRATYCGRINSAHLLLGVLASSDSLLVSDLRQGGIDVAALQRAAREAIHQDGEIATSQRRFTPAAQRALDRARDFAEREGRHTWGPENLFRALMPQEISLKAAAKERLRYGSEIDDPAARVLAESGITFAQPASQATETAPAKASYTEGFQKVWAMAQLSAQSGKATGIEPLHMLYGIAASPDSLAYEALRRGGGDLETWRRQVPANWQQQAEQAVTEGKEWDIPPSEITRQTITRAVNLAHTGGYKHTSPEQFLYVLLTMAGPEKHPEVAAAFQGVDVEAARDFLKPHVIRQNHEPRPEEKVSSTFQFPWRPAVGSFIVTGVAFYLLQKPTSGVAVTVFCIQLLTMVITLLAILSNHPTKHNLTSYVAGFVLGILVWSGLFNLIRL